MSAESGQPDPRTLQASLRVAEPLLRLAVGAADVGTFLWYPEEDRGEPDMAMMALLGNRVMRGTGFRDALLAAVGLEGRGRLAEALANAVRRGGSGMLHEELRIEVAHGTPRWIALVAGTCFDGSAGHPDPACMIGLAYDISARILASRPGTGGLVQMNTQLDAAGPHNEELAALLCTGVAMCPHLDPDQAKAIDGG